MVSLLASKYTFNITNIIIIINYIIFIILVIIMMEFLLAHWRVGCESTPRPVSSAPQLQSPSHSSQWSARSRASSGARVAHQETSPATSTRGWCLAGRAVWGTVTGARGRSLPWRGRLGPFGPASLLKELAGAVLVAQFKDRARWCDPACTRSGARRGAPPANQPLRQHQTSLLMILPCRK